MPKTTIERIELALDILRLPECLSAYKPSTLRQLEKYMFRYQELKSKPSIVRFAGILPLYASSDFGNYLANSLRYYIESYLESIMRNPKKYMKKETFAVTKRINKLPNRDHYREIGKIVLIRHRKIDAEDFHACYEHLNAIYDRNTFYGLWPHAEAQLRAILPRYQAAVESMDNEELRVVAGQIAALNEAVYMPRQHENRLVAFLS